VYVAQLADGIGESNRDPRLKALHREVIRRQLALAQDDRRRFCDALITEGTARG